MPATCSRVSPLGYATVTIIIITLYKYSLYFSRRAGPRVWQVGGSTFVEGGSACPVPVGQRRWGVQGPKPAPKKEF